MTKAGKLKQAIQGFQRPKLQWGWSDDDLVADFDIPGEFTGTLRIEDNSYRRQGYKVSVENELGIPQVIESSVPDLLRAILRAEELLFADYPTAKSKAKSDT